VLSCTSKPPAATETSAASSSGTFTEPGSPGSRPVDEDELNFDPSTVPREVFEYTKVDVQHFIENLNKIIRVKNYNGWIANLGEDYLNEKNSREYLLQVSGQPRLKTHNIVLASAHDYFIYVVVPSRANDRVDDIEFVTQKRVKAFTVTETGQRLRLYDLEYVNDTWKITN
jgi:hypothetical protein